MNGGRIIGNFASLFGAAVSVSGSFTLNDGIIEQNETDLSSKHNNPSSASFYDNASVIIGQSSSFLMTGGQLIGNMSTVSGSSKVPTFTFTDGVVKGNFRILNGLTARLSGGTLNGSIYINKGSCIVSDSALIHGGKNENGGSVHIEGGNFEMQGGTIRNSSAENGGAIYISNGNFSMSGGTIYDCEAEIDGGAVFVYGGNVKMTGGKIGKIENNKKLGSKAIRGGALYISSGTFEMSGGEIEGNTATESGGAIQISDGNVYITGGKILSNVARGEASETGYGGGIFVDGGEEVSITGGEISNNVAAKNGGGIEVKTNNAVVVDVYSGKFIGNVADECGGAVGIECDNGTINVGEEMCDGTDATGHEHPIISDNIAGMQGGGFYINGLNAVLNIYCSSIDDNDVKNVENNFEQLNGTSNIFDGVQVGESNEGIIIVGGTFVDKREFSDDVVVITYYSNFEGSLEFKQASITKGTLITVPGNIFGVQGYNVIGWTEDQSNDTLIEYATGTVIELVEDITMYALWVPDEANEASFIVIIPDELFFNNNEEMMTFSLEVTLNLFPRNKALNINLVDEDFELKLYEDGDIIDSASYVLCVDEREISSNGTVLSAYSDSALITYKTSETLEVVLLDKPKFVGEYQDTLTFTVSVGD